MHVKTETITPAKAEQYLATQQRNRTVRFTHVQTLTAAMLNNTFLIAGDPIRFNTSGELIDGQHRLLACIASGQPFEAVIVTDLDPTTQDVIDTGIKRSPGDIFALKGYKASNHLTATLRWLWRFDHGYYTGYVTSPQTSGLDAALLNHPHVKDSLPIGTQCSKLLIKSLGAALHTLCTEHHPHEAMRFFDQLIHGVGLFNSDPVYLLRTRLLRNATGKARLPYYETAAITIKAFNATVQGKKLRSLRWTSEGDKTEPFPTLI